MKRKTLIILFLLLGGIKMLIAINGDTYSRNQLIPKHELFNSRINSSSSNFNEHISSRNSYGSCPMCGASSGGNVCGTCNYLVGSALGSGSDTGLPLDEDVQIFFLFGVLSLLFILFRRKNIIINKMS